MMNILHVSFEVRLLLEFLGANTTFKDAGVLLEKTDLDDIEKVLILGNYLPFDGHQPCACQGYLCV